MVFPLLLSALLLPSDAPLLRVRVDSTRHEVRMTIGPMDLPAMAGGDHAAMHASGHDLPLLRFNWPVSGWMRGFRIEIRDGEGRPLPRRLMHHVNLLHLERRRFLEPVFERTLAAGQETADLLLPPSIGLRVERGAAMALFTAFVNEGGETLRGVTLELVVPYLDARTMPRPREVRPFDIDIGFHAGVTSAFDLVPGRSVHQREFTAPVTGRILGVGGHLHDYAESIVLIDAATGRELVALRTTAAVDGKVTGVSRQMPGITGEGIRLRAGRRYRLVAVYQNPTGRTIPDGGMAAMAGILAPDDVRQWPRLDPEHPAFLADLAGLESLGRPMAMGAAPGQHVH